MAASILKMVFLEISIMTTWSVFQSQVTFFEFLAKQGSIIYPSYNYGLSVSTVLLIMGI